MSAKTLGRLAGLLLLIQLAGLIVPFVLLAPAVTPQFVRDAASHRPAVETATLLLLANGALSLVIAVIMFTEVRKRQLVTAMLLLLAGMAWTGLQAVDNQHIRSMLRLSEHRAGSDTTSASTSIAETLRDRRMTVHYATLAAIEAWFLAFYVVLMRAHHIPRILGTFGILMVALHVLGITAPRLLDFRQTVALGPSLALSHVIVAVWLLVKGFSPRDESERTLSA